MAWVFNPIFQLLYILLVWLQKITGDVGIAIILMTLIVRAALIPLFRRQIVSTKRMQLIQPEIRELQKRYKGDRAKFSQAQMELYKERGVNPASGCLPLLLQLPLLMIIYSVISQGLTNPNPSAMFNFFGLHLVDYTCVNGVGGRRWRGSRPLQALHQHDRRVARQPGRLEDLGPLPEDPAAELVQRPGRGLGRPSAGPEPHDHAPVHRRLQRPELEGPAAARPVPAR